MALSNQKGYPLMAGDQGASSFVTRPRQHSGTERTISDAHIVTLTTPPAWSEDAWCYPYESQTRAQWAKNPYDRDKMSDEDAINLCAGCPVLQSCLKSALKEEAGLGAGQRHGIRGGFTPAVRAALDTGEEDRRRTICGNYLHEMTEENTRVTPGGYVVCRACERASQSRRIRRTRRNLEPSAA